MLKQLRLPIEIVLYMLAMYYYGEYAVSRESSNYILWPSTLVMIFLTWYIIKQTLKTIFKNLEL
jgi:hypothetical protein